MNTVVEKYSFAPPRRIGLVIYIIAILILTGLAAGGIWRGMSMPIGVFFLLYLLPGGLALILVPFLGYRAYALSGAYYTLERDGIHMHWGLRIEDIPMTEILWVRPVNNSLEAGSFEPPLPYLRWPGVLVGTRHLKGGMSVEYMASSRRNLVLIATAKHIFGVSPSNVQGFMAVYQHFSELGSIAPIPPRSVYPALFLAKVWSAWPSRILILGGLLLGLVLLIWVVLFIPTRQEVYMGFISDTPVTSSHLLIVPLLNGLFYLFDLFLGLFIYRVDVETSLPQGATPGQRSTSPGRLVSSAGSFLAYILWGSSMLTSILFMVGLHFISLLG